MDGGAARASEREGRETEAVPAGLFTDAAAAAAAAAKESDCQSSAGAAPHFERVARTQCKFYYAGRRARARVLV